MNKVIFQNLRFRKWVVLLWLMAVAAIFSILPLCFTLLQDVSMQAESDVTYYARGSYDLLIRPQENISDIERELGIVHENYLGAGNGGISVEQWQSIKAREDIDIAAPVSSLGYFTGISTNFAVQPFPSSSTRYRTELLTTDNIHTYTIDSFDGILLESSRPASSFMDHHGNPPFDAIIADLRLMSEFQKKIHSFCFRIRIIYWLELIRKKRRS
ncbi:hypothetical protein SAMN05421736_11297 [Evansella caseinilytica]|uniref:Uncharacterized protein n=1 Tax=Evansella caseinilytica TaxID=1503961 RepID=A0A1H3SXV0_9BACI|nr:hypothetical protein [Evansella caseinilytica]SDZ42391.1 hypothetical protein SAMN05421736_11297 [Evansella caseinilytica]